MAFCFFLSLWTQFNFKSESYPHMMGTGDLSQYTTTKVKRGQNEGKGKKEQSHWGKTEGINTRITAGLIRTESMSVWTWYGWLMTWKPLQQVKTQGEVDDPPLMRNPLKPSRQPVWCLQEAEAVIHPEAPGAAAAFGCMSKRTSTTSTAQHSQFTGSFFPSLST